MKTYLIKYGVYTTGGWFESGQMRVKNCLSGVHAQVRLEGYLKRKHTDFKCLVVYECHEDVVNGLFRNIFGNTF